MNIRLKLTVFPDGTTSSDTIAFRILPPWYRSAAAYVCYIILALLALWYVYRWDDVRETEETAGGGRER